MAQRIIIPTLLRRITGDADTVEIEAHTVREIIDKIDARYPGFRPRVCDDEGELRRFINIYIDGEDIRFLNNLSTQVPDGAEVSIIPAISGG